MLKLNQLGTDSSNFCYFMKNKLVTTATTHSWLEEEIRFNPKDVVEPQESNWIDK
jgi:hypothetical protein